METVSVVGGGPEPHTYYIQIAGPGTVTTHFLTREHVQKLHDDSRVALMRTSQGDDDTCAKAMGATV